MDYYKNSLRYVKILLFLVVFIAIFTTVLQDRMVDMVTGQSSTLQEEDGDATADDTQRQQDINKFQQLEEIYVQDRFNEYLRDNPKINPNSYEKVKQGFRDEFRVKYSNTDPSEITYDFASGSQASSDEEFQRQQEEEMRRQQEEQMRQQEEILRQQEIERQQEEMRRQQEEQQQEFQRQQEEMRRQQEEEMRRQQEEMRRQQEEQQQEFQRQQEEIGRQQEEMRRQQEEHMRQQEEFRRQREEFQRRQEMQHHNQEQFRQPNRPQNNYGRR